jgi:REP element-mobilizing transposase RayT
MSKRPKQLEFQGSAFKKPKDWFGGAYLKGNHAKGKRPLESRFAIHVVLRASESGLRRPAVYRHVNLAVTRACKKYGVKLYEYANVGNHLHLLIKLPHVRAWKAFIREVTGRIAQIARGLKGRQKGTTAFWRHRPFTRVVRGWKRAYRLAKDYVVLNQLEAEGLISRAATRAARASFSPNAPPSG